LNQLLLLLLSLSMLSSAAKAADRTYTELGPIAPPWVTVTPTFTDPHTWTFSVDTNGHEIASFHVYDRGDLTGGGSYYGANPGWGPLQTPEYGTFYWQSYSNQSQVIDTTDRNHPYYVPWKFWVSSDKFTSSTQFYYSVDVVASVPEPETYAMLLAGLGLMGALVRRKQQ
jgi:hypothetical protein